MINCCLYHLLNEIEWKISTELRRNLMRALSPEFVLFFARSCFVGSAFVEEELCDSLNDRLISGLRYRSRVFYVIEHSRNDF